MAKAIDVLLLDAAAELGRKVFQPGMSPAYVLDICEDRVESIFVGCMDHIRAARRNGCEVNLVAVMTVWVEKGISPDLASRIAAETQYMQ